MRNVLGRRTVMVLVLSSVVLFFLGCSKQKEKTGNVSAQDNSPVLATVGNSPLTVSDFKGYVSDKLPSHPGKVSKAQLDQWLDHRLLEEVLYQEALRVGLERDPQIRRDIRQMLTSRLIDDHMKKNVWSKPIDDAEIEKYYNDHWSEFNRPDQVRIGDIFISIPAGVSPDERKALGEKAEEILKKALEVRGKRFGFGRLINEYSDIPQKYRKGDTGFFDERGEPIGIDKTLVDTAFSLTHVGDMANQVIETSQGYHVIMLTGKRSGMHTSLDSIRQRLTQRVRREKAAGARKAYIAGLKKKAKREVNEKVLVGILESTVSTS